VTILYGAVATALVVNEVLYDPAGADAGREFVELVALESVALNGWTLEAGDGAGGTWRAVWRGSGSIVTGTFFVVGGDSVRAAHARLTGDLQNGPDAIRLVDPRGQVHDRVGWGGLDDALFFETQPAADVASRSLARDPDARDSDDNGRDFVAATPTPGRRNRARRDLALALEPPDPLYAWPGRSLRATVTVHNRGSDAVGDWDVTARWSRVVATDTLAPRALHGARTGAATLVPGDSTRIVFVCNDGIGLYRLDVHGRFADEDSSSDRVAAWVRIGSSDLVIDEILYAPVSGEAEWIELHNRGGAAIALAGHTLTDRSRRRATLRGTAALAPGARGIVAADTTTAIRGLAATAPRWAAVPWPSLNDSGEGDWADALVLRDTSGIVADALGYAAVARERGRSIERIAVQPDARGVGWAPCTAPTGATPGLPNSIQAAPVGAGAAFELRPNPFSPGRDGADDRIVVHAVVPAGYTGCRIEVFDLDGRRRARLLADALGPGPRTLAWAGTADSGSPLELGAQRKFT